ncbi:hypothetical protein R0V13_08795 [Facklamia hominis]|uniref:hypothetical protein n=1 Tax=Facklamia hominis TaxID=178214 RepID=UPI0029D40E15|nr:hypothetical protein [Facklamia hominis]WPJ90569.1 hypothetical protein R0V13_08795 [Facklamia hominis]
MTFIRLQVKALLDRNAWLFSALIFLGMSLFGAVQDSSSGYGDLSLWLQLEGMLCLYGVIVTELAKPSLIRDKQTKRLEFLLANGLPLKQLVRGYLVSLYLASLIVWLPSLLFEGLQAVNHSMGKPFFLLMMPLLIQSFLITWGLVNAILSRVNLGRLNAIQYQTVLVNGILAGLSLAVYHDQSMVEYYLGTKLLLLVLVGLWLKRRRTIEGIVRSYY